MVTFLYSHDSRKDGWSEFSLSMFILWSVKKTFLKERRERSEVKQYPSYNHINFSTALISLQQTNGSL